ncbi:MULTISPECIES: hypothetical protein [Idiomarina]|nr:MULTISPECIES: hypothetical protein [Idiomarina]
MILRFLMILAAAFFMSACTTGKLYYTEQSGNRILGCDVEFVGLPSVDKFAVEYALSLCAKSVVHKGHQLDGNQQYLVNLDTSIPEAPCGHAWNHDLAKAKFTEGLLSKKQYGYIVAHIDLGLAVVNECSPNNAQHSLPLVAGTPTRCAARRPCALR